MSEEVFTSLMGEMWEKEKGKQEKKKRKEAINFAKHITDLVITNKFPNGTWEEIYDNWKSKK